METHLIKALVIILLAREKAPIYVMGKCPTPHKHFKLNRIIKDLSNPEELSERIQGVLELLDPKTLDTCYTNAIEYANIVYRD